MKQIEGFEDYSISCCGNVIGPRKELKPQYDKDGYPKVHLYLNGKMYNKFVHRLMAEAWIPNPNNLPIVNHIDGIKSNCHVLNLEWCNQSHNELHAHRTGLKHGMKGESNPRHKLTDKQVLEIKAKYIPFKYSMYKLAREYNVSPTIICYVINNKTWVK